LCRGAGPVSAAHPAVFLPITPDTYPALSVMRSGNESPEQAALPVYNKDLLI